MSGKAEIGEFDDDALRLVLLTHQILRFQVSVHDSLAMHVVESEAELLDDACHLLLGEVPLFLDCIEKVSTRDELHHDVIVALIFQKLKDSCNVRVVCLFQNLELVLVELFVHLNIQTFLGDDLDSTGGS